MLRQKLIQLPKTLIVTRNAGVQVAVSLPKLYSRHRMHSLLITGLYKVHHPRGIINIGNTKNICAIALGLFYQRFRREGAVAEAEVGMIIIVQSI